MYFEIKTIWHADLPEQEYAEQLLSQARQILGERKYATSSYGGLREACLVMQESYQN